MSFVTKNACPHQELDTRFRPLIERCAILSHNLALAVISLACDPQGQPIGQHQSTHGLFVDSQGAGLVTADMGTTTQPFNGSEFAFN